MIELISSFINRREGEKKRNWW